MDHRKAFALMLAFAVLIAAGLYSFLRLERIGPSSGHTTVRQIAAFTLEGCGACSSAEEAVKRLEKKAPSLNYRYYVVDRDSEAMERFAVTSHPTVLFQNKYGQELARLEQEISEEDLLAMLAKLKANPRFPVVNAPASPSHHDKPSS